MLLQFTLFGSGGLNQTCIGPNDIIVLVDKITQAVMAISGGIAIVYIVWAGIRYMMAGGEEAAMSVAKRSIQWAVVGLLIIILAYTLVNFVATQLLNANNTSDIRITNNFLTGPEVPTANETRGSWCTGSTTNNTTTNTTTNTTNTTTAP